MACILDEKLAKTKFEVFVTTTRQYNAVFSAIVAETCIALISNGCSCIGLWSSSDTVALQAFKSDQWPPAAE